MQTPAPLSLEDVYSRIVMSSLSPRTGSSCEGAAGDSPGVHDARALDGERERSGSLPSSPKPLPRRALKQPQQQEQRRGSPVPPLLPPSVHLATGMMPGPGPPPIAAAEAGVESSMRRSAEWRRHEAQDVALALAASVPSAGAAAPGSPSGGGRRRGPDAPRVLVVDDSAINQMVALRFLKKYGLPAEAVGDGAQALCRLYPLRASPSALSREVHRGSSELAGGEEGERGSHSGDPPSGRGAGAADEAGEYPGADVSASHGCRDAEGARGPEELPPFDIVLMDIQVSAPCLLLPAPCVARPCVPGDPCHRRCPCHCVPQLSGPGARTFPCLWWSTEPGCSGLSTLSVPTRNGTVTLWGPLKGSALPPHPSRCQYWMG